MSSVIVALSGLDGSGKSTQIDLLKKFLQKNGKNFYYFHAVEFSMSNKILNRKRKKEGSVTKANWLKIQLRKIALIIDIFRFRRLIKKIKVDYIISDRYFYDSVVNINFLSGNNKKLCAEKFIPKPDFVFYLKVSPEIIMQRERKPDQGLEYLLRKDEISGRKIKFWNMIILDGQKDKIKISNEIIDKIQENGKKGKI